MSQRRKRFTKAAQEEASRPPLEVRELRKSLKAFLNNELKADSTGLSIRIGSVRFGVYAFFDYDGEPIYVGQTCESLSSRIGRHLTGQRSDPVANNILDPFEVAEIEVWPLIEYQRRKARNPEAHSHLDALESAVFRKALRESRFKSVLNEVIPSRRRRVRLPKSHRGSVVSDQVRALRAHPDVRLARRATTLARLAQVISERQVAPGLRRTLLTQARRLQWLAGKRFTEFHAEVSAIDKRKQSSERRE